MMVNGRLENEVLMYIVQPSSVPLNLVLQWCTCYEYASVFRDGLILHERRGREGPSHRQFHGVCCG